MWWWYNMGELTFARHTNSILNMFPYWFQIRKKSKDSLGARFLNISGLELDDARYVIDYAYSQCYINTVDLTQVDFCYKCIVPMPYKLSELKGVYANTAGLIKAKSLKEFFGIDVHINNKNLNPLEYYYIDEARNIIYVRNKYNVDANYDNGKIRLVFKDDTETVQRLIPHQVWNYLDELGTLLACPRLPKEPNVEYKKRIMDVFINYAGASKPGLINGIGRELATRKVIHWHDTTRDLELEDPMIVLNSITINKEPVDLERVFITDAGTVLIKAFKDKMRRDKCIVSYVYGLEMHQLHNRKDIKLYNELFTVEGKAKNKLRQYIDIINSEAPIFWDQFHWNEHYWDMNESNVIGVGYIPHLYDGSIRGFQSYGFVKQR